MTISPNITIFGGTGDLTFRKLLPALYTMHVAGKLPENSRILIIGRRDYDSAAYRETARNWVEKFTRLPFRPADFQAFAGKIDYYRSRGLRRLGAVRRGLPRAEPVLRR